MRGVPADGQDEGACEQGTGSAARLASLVQEGRATVAVLGLGYVGLVLAVTVAERGFPVIGLDTNSARVDALNSGRSYLGSVSRRRLRSVVKQGRFSASGDPTRLAEADIIAICVPTPLTQRQEPDLRHVVAAAESVATHMREGQLVVLESTTYPGTTEEIVLPILQRSGLSCGRDFFLAYCPEREDPGNQRYRAKNTPRVLGAADPISAGLSLMFFRQVTPLVVQVSSPRVAEATKLMENVFRAVNIALVNELKMVYERMGIDIWEVLEAAGTKPFGFMRFDPGPGWGGHCIPVDPFYLSWKARRHGIDARFIELAGQINIRMHEYVVQRVVHALSERNKLVKGARVLLLGVAYKRNIDDVRESPALVIFAHLESLGAHLTYHDPLVPKVPPTSRYPRLTGMMSCPLSARMIEEQDAVILVTDHETIDYDLVLGHAQLIVDTRGVFRGKGTHIVPA